MKTSMNGLRKKITYALNKFCQKDTLKKLSETEFARLDDLARLIGALNCVYQPGDNDFTDMHEEKINLIDDENDGEED